MNRRTFGRPLALGLGLCLVALDSAAAQPAATAPATEAVRPKVRLIATGGTISNRTGGRLTADELLKSMPTLDRYVRADGEQFANVASTAMTLDQVSAGVAIRMSVLSHLLAGEETTA